MELSFRLFIAQVAITSKINTGPQRRSLSTATLSCRGASSSRSRGHWATKSSITCRKSPEARSRSNRPRLLTRCWRTSPFSQRFAETIAEETALAGC